MSTSDVVNYLTTDFMPVIVNANSAANRGVFVFMVTSGGSGYPDGTYYTKLRGDGSGGIAKLIVSGNSIESPRLLLLSESSMFPDGLANSSGEVGRNYMRHMTGSMYARFDKPVNFYRGETMAGFCADEVKHDPNRGFVGGYYMETLALGPAFLGAFLEPGGWGREFTNMMDGYEKFSIKFKCPPFNN